MDALRYFQSCRFDGGLFDSGREAWQGGIGLRAQILPLKRPSCVCGEEGGGRRVEGGGWREEGRGRWRQEVGGMKHVWGGA